MLWLSVGRDSWSSTCVNGWNTVDFHLIPLPIKGVQLMEVRTSFGILRPFFVALLDFLEILVDVLPFFFASFGVPIVSMFSHGCGDLFPKRSFRPILLVLLI